MRLPCVGVVWFKGVFLVPAAAGAAESAVLVVGGVCCCWFGDEPLLVARKPLSCALEITAESGILVTVVDEAEGDGVVV